MDTYIDLLHPKLSGHIGVFSCIVGVLSVQY